MRDLTLAHVVRIALGVVGVLVILGGIGAVALGEPIAELWALVVGGVLTVVALFEVTRYGPKADPTRSRDGFEPSGEVFIDPTTGDRMRVWHDPRTGTRRYEHDGVPDSDRGEI